MSTFCKPGDDQCFRIAIDCTKETDADKRLVLCATATTLGAYALGCGKAAADNVCSTTTAGTVNASGGSGYTGTGIDGFLIEATGVKVSGICCDGKATTDCNNTIDCMYGQVDAGTVINATNGFMNALTGIAAPVSKQCALLDDYCLVIVVDCSAETVDAQTLVVCASATTTTA